MDLVEIRETIKKRITTIKTTLIASSPFDVIFKAHERRKNGKKEPPRETFED